MRNGSSLAIIKHMNGKVDIRVEIDPKRSEPRVVIQTAETSELVENLIYAIEQCVENEYPQVPVTLGESVVMLNQWDIVRLHTENRKLSIHTLKDVFESRSTLQDIEKLLDPDCFVRISRFEIINLKKASGFDFSVAGTIKVYFEDGSETYVARRYVSAIRALLNSVDGKGVRS